MTTPLYRAATRALTPAALGYTVWRAGRDGGRRYWRQRRGRDLPDGPFSVWLHCASVGEVRAAAPLAAALAEGAPGPLLVTTNTATGAAEAARILPEAFCHAYLPLDTPAGVRRFLDRAAPACALVLETEIWPNLFDACRSRGIPLALVNGRLSQRTLGAPAPVRRALGRALGAVGLCLARSEGDAERFRALGMPEGAVRVAGNLKYARAAPAEASAEPIGLGRSYVLAASTREGEEALVARAWATVADRQPLLVIAPRHPERREVVLADLRRQGWTVAVRSRGEPVTADTAIYLADTLGELTGLFAGAEVVFMGGSLVPKGGHNVLEPAAAGRAIVTGPHTANFADEVAALRAAGGLWQVDGPEGLAAAWQQLLAEPDTRAALAEAARAVVAEREYVLTDYRAELAAWCPSVLGGVNPSTSR